MPVEPPELLPLLRGAVAGAGALLSTALGEADRRAGGPSAAWGPALQSVNASLPRGGGDAISRNVADVLSSITRRLALGRRGKAALLALCVCALRFGLVSTLTRTRTLALTLALALALALTLTLTLTRCGRCLSPPRLSYRRRAAVVRVATVGTSRYGPMSGLHLHAPPRTFTHLHAPPRICRSWWAVRCATYCRGEGRAATPRPS